MITLKKIIKESRLGPSTGTAPENGNHGDTRKFSPEVKRHFLEIVSTYNKYQEMMDRKSDIIEVAETLGGIIEAAKELAINEGDDWFDKHTVKRNMNELGKLGQQFEKVVVEAKALDQRLSGLYEDMGHILSRYYKIGEITEDEMKSRLGMRNENADPNKFKKGFIQGDIIVNDSNSRYVVVQNKGVIYVVGDNGERRQQIKQGSGVKFGPNIKADLGLRDISESINEEIFWVNSNNKVELGKFYDEVKNFMPDHSIQKLSPLSIQFDISRKDLNDVIKMAKSYNGLKVVKESKINEYDEWANTRIQAKNIFRMLKLKYKNNIEDMKKGLEDVLKQNKTKPDQAEVMWDEFNKYFKIKESVKESFTPKDIEMIKKVVDKEKKLIGLSPIFKKMGWWTDFVMMDSVPPHLKIRKNKNDKDTYLLVNKKYVDRPDWVSGEIAGGLDESKQPSQLNEQDLIHLSSVPYFIDGYRGDFISTSFGFDDDAEFGTSDWKKISKKLSSKDKIIVKRIIDAMNESKCSTCGKSSISEDIKYSPEGYVKLIKNEAGKIVKDITLKGNTYRYNSVYKTYNSVKGNELLHKRDLD